MDDNNQNNNPIPIDEKINNIDNLNQVMDGELINMEQEIKKADQSVHESEIVPEVNPKTFKRQIPKYLRDLNRQTLEFLFLEQKEAFGKVSAENITFCENIINLQTEIQNLESQLQGQEITDLKIKKLEDRLRALEGENLKLKSESETVEQRFKHERRELKKDCQKQVYDMKEKLNLVNDKYKEISRFEVYISELEKDNRALNEKFGEFEDICKNSAQQEYEKYQLKLDNIRKKILSTLDLAKITIMQNSVDKVNNGNKIMMLQNSQLFMELNNQSTLVEKLLLDLRNKEALIKKLRFDLQIHEDLKKLLSTHNLNFKNMLKKLKPEPINNPIISELEALEKQKELLYQNFKNKSQVFFKHPEVQIPDKHIMIPQENEDIEEKQKWKLDKNYRKSAIPKLTSVKSCTRFSRTSSGNFQVLQQFPDPNKDSKKVGDGISLSEQIIGCKDNPDKLLDILLRYQTAFETLNNFLYKNKDKESGEQTHNMQSIEGFLQEFLSLVKKIQYEREEIKIFNLKGINCTYKFNPKKYENKVKAEIFKTYNSQKLSKFDIRKLI